MSEDHDWRTAWKDARSGLATALATRTTADLAKLQPRWHAALNAFDELADFIERLDRVAGAARKYCKDPTGFLFEMLEEELRAFGKGAQPGSAYVPKADYDACVAEGVLAEVRAEKAEAERDRLAEALRLSEANREEDERGYREALDRMAAENAVLRQFFRTPNESYEPRTRLMLAAHALAEAIREREDVTVPTAIARGVLREYERVRAEAGGDDAT